MIKEKRNFLRCWKARHFVEQSNTWDFDCLAVQENLDSLLQHHNSKVSVLQCSAFSMVQFSHPFMTTGKTTALTIWTLISKVMSLLFNMLSMSCHGFPRSKHFLISWLQSPSAVIFEPKETKPVTASTIRHWHSKIFKAKQKLTLNWLSHKQHPDLNSL